jgi:pyruvate carboxylase
MRAEFARACNEAGLCFVGPDAAHLDLCGDKARDFFASLDGAPMIVKAVAGGGGRGTRAVLTQDEIEPDFHRCQRKALAAFGCDDLYVEAFIPRARHVEV